MQKGHFQCHKGSGPNPWRTLIFSLCLWNHLIIPKTINLKKSMFKIICFAQLIFSVYRFMFSIKRLRQQKELICHKALKTNWFRTGQTSVKYRLVPTETFTSHWSRLFANTGDKCSPLGTLFDTLKCLNFKMVFHIWGFHLSLHGVFWSPSRKCCSFIPQMLLLLILFLHLLNKSFLINPRRVGKSLHIKPKKYNFSLIVPVTWRDFSVITRISTPKLIFILWRLMLVFRQLTPGIEIFPKNQFSLNEILTPRFTIYHPTHCLQSQFYFEELLFIDKCFSSYL